MDTAVSLFLRGEDTLGAGWIARAERLLDGLPIGPEHGYLRYITEVEGGLDAGSLDAALAAAEEVRRIGEEHGDPNLVAVALVCGGRARLRRGEVAAGWRSLDEATVAVREGDLEPEWAGNTYCHLMAACHELADTRRAAEWTELTARWLAQQDAAVLFTGICRVHRSQVLQNVGDWARAEREAAQVCADLAGLSVASVAEAHYQLGELHRLRGQLDAAGAAYLRARELGRDPQPGLALLRLAEGRPDAAARGIAAAISAVGADRVARARLCPALVEITLAAGDLDRARDGCAELEAAAHAYGTSGLEAAALQCRGAVMLAEDRPTEALPALRAACRRWHDLDVPYEAARTSVLLAEAYHRLGDDDGAGAERDAALAIFARLGAQHDVEKATAHTLEREIPGGLTGREAEVLALVATGRTNRELADALTLSGKTVARHLSNIFVKLGVSTRTEAAAFAFEHGIAPPGNVGRSTQGADGLGTIPRCGAGPLLPSVAIDR